MTAQMELILHLAWAKVRSMGRVRFQRLPVTASVAVGVLLGTLGSTWTAAACPAPHQWLTLQGWSRDGQAFLAYGDATDRGAYIEARDERGELLLDLDTPHAELAEWDRKLRIRGRMVKGPRSPDGRWELRFSGDQLLLIRLYDAQTARTYLVDVLWDATEEVRYRTQVEEAVWRDDSSAFAVRSRSLGPPDEPCYDDEDVMPEGDASYDRVVTGTPSAVLERAEWIRRFFEDDPSLRTALPDSLDPLLMLASAVDLLGAEGPHVLGRALSSEDRPWHLSAFDPTYLQALIPVVRVEVRGMAPPPGLRAYLEQDSPTKAVVITRGDPDIPPPGEPVVRFTPGNVKVARKVAAWLPESEGRSPAPPSPVEPVDSLDVARWVVGDELLPAVVLSGPISPIRIDWTEVGVNVRKVSEVLATLAVREALSSDAGAGARAGRASMRQPMDASPLTRRALEPLPSQTKGTPPDAELSPVSSTTP